jgi:gamma-glutamyltranspeptidase/glutathione hydrolase
MRFVDALIGGRAVGTPGLVRLLDHVHRLHGRLAWSRLVEPAERIAREGFAVSPRLNALLEGDRFLRADAQARALYYRPDGHALAVGERLRNPALAAVLRRIGQEGAEAFYRGDLADAMVRRVRSHPSPGHLAQEDLARYRVIEREPVCAPFAGHRVCTVPPPSSGGVTMLQILQLVERVGVAGLPAGGLMSVHAFAEAGRLAFADRDRYLADPAFVPVPVAGLLAPAYLDARRELIDPRRSMRLAHAGLPAGHRPGDGGQQFELPSTTHLSVIDDAGNAVAMSSSIESAFGSRTMVEGFLLNNQLTDFSFQPQREGARVANRVEPGKRPRSTMAPTMVFDARGRLELVLGSPGGSWIANYVAQVLMLRHAQGLSLADAVAAPHWGSRNGSTEVERGIGSDSLIDGLRLLGHEVRTIDMTSGIHAIERAPGGWLGVADPRREGAAAGR